MHLNIRKTGVSRLSLIFGLRLLPELPSQPLNGCARLSWSTAAWACWLSWYWFFSLSLQLQVATIPFFLSLIGLDCCGFRTTIPWRDFQRHSQLTRRPRCLRCQRIHGVCMYICMRICTFHVFYILTLNFQIPAVRGELPGSVFRCRCFRPGQGLRPRLRRLLLRSSGLEQERPEQGEIPDQWNQGLLMCLFPEEFTAPLCVIYDGVLTHIYSSNSSSGVVIVDSYEWW